MLLREKLTEALGQRRQPIVVVLDVWGRMVYIIPVLAVMLFLAAGLKCTKEDATNRNLDDGTDIEGTDA